MDHGGRNRKRVARNTQHNSGHAEGTWEEEMIPGGLDIQKVLQESPNNTHAKPCLGDYIPLCSV